MDWSQYQTTKFKPILKDPDFDAKGSCGVSALAYLTGLTQRTIDRSTPKKCWWSDREMMKFLRARGFEVIPITEERNYQNKETFSWMNYYKRSLNHLNVILISQHVSRREGTWALAYNNRYYHGREKEIFSGYELLSNPLWTSFVIWHKSWKSDGLSIDYALRDQIALVDITRREISIFEPYSATWDMKPIPKTDEPNLH